MHSLHIRNTDRQFRTLRRVFSLLLRVASAVIVGAFVLGVIGVVLVREGWQRARLNIFMRPPL